MKARGEVWVGTPSSPGLSVEVQKHLGQVILTGFLTVLTTKHSANNRNRGERGYDWWFADFETMRMFDEVLRLFQTRAVGNAVSYWFDLRLVAFQTVPTLTPSNLAICG